jgi:hypothetical protein
MADTKRRARGEDSIFFAPSRKCWVGEITVGWKADGRRDGLQSGGRPRPKSRTSSGPSTRSWTRVSGRLPTTPSSGASRTGWTA